MYESFLELHTFIVVEVRTGKNESIVFAITFQIILWFWKPGGLVVG